MNLLIKPFAAKCWRIVSLVAVLAAVASCDREQRSITGAPGGAPYAAAAVTTSSVTISPNGDTFLNLDAMNNAANDSLNLYTWPDNKIANAIVMKFDLTSIPTGSTIISATLNLYLFDSDATTDSTYTVTVHRIVNKNPTITSTTGYTYDGVHGWTPNGCCYNNVPLAQADISTPVDTRSIDKTVGFKQWDVTSIVQGWFNTPATNFGLLVNSDPSKLADRHRFFRSNEAAVDSQRPYLTVVYTPPAGGGGVVFQSDWSTALGTSKRAVYDSSAPYGPWTNYWEFNLGDTTVQLLSVVAGGPNGGNALRVQQRGAIPGYSAVVQVDHPVPPATDFYVRFYMRNDDTSPADDHVVTVDIYKYENLTYIKKDNYNPAGWHFVSSMFGCGYTYPIGHWGPNVTLTRGAWYRFEYFVDYIDSTHIQVHPRVYDATGTQILGDSDFQQSDFGSAMWNGRNDWTLASYYAAGYNFCVNPSPSEQNPDNLTPLTSFALGNNGQNGAVDTGLYWYYAGVQIRTDRWPGP